MAPVPDCLPARFVRATDWRATRSLGRQRKNRGPSRSGEAAPALGLKFPLPFSPFTACMFIAYWSTANAIASALRSRTTWLTLSDLSRAVW
jgi:hypothetical protein